MEKLKMRDILILDSKAYVSMDLYRRLLESLQVANDLVESLHERLTSIEVANENRRSMKIVKMIKK